MSYLVASNLLLRSVQVSSPLHTPANRAVATLLARGERIFLVPQVLVEFWAVTTRPAGLNGLGLPIAAAQAETVRLKQMFPLLPDNALIHPAWENLVHTVGVSGKQVHDARLVAAMHVHGVSHVLTFNGSDFVRFQSVGPGIIVVDPGNV